jgi:hypothetical protein
MALTWNITECHQRACWDANDNMTSTCEAMIWATMIVGIDHITAKNIKEFAFRLETDRRLLGTFRTFNAMPFTVDDMVPFIGLKTNATRKTRAQWSKTLIKTFEDITFNKENA